MIRPVTDYSGRKLFVDLTKIVWMGLGKLLIDETKEWKTLWKVSLFGAADVCLTEGEGKRFLYVWINSQTPNPEGHPALTIDDADRFLSKASPE